MTKRAIYALSIFILSACANPSKKSEQHVTKEPAAVGADKDEHGCLSSAGYTWSEIKQDCIQIFNEGFRLNPVENEKGKAVISAFVLLSDDQSKLELFLPDDTVHTVVLQQTDKETYQDNIYTYDANKSLLYADGKVIYKGNVE